MVQALPKGQLVSDFESTFAKSKALYEAAREFVAGGIAHDGRHQKPFPIYVDHADGAYKWEVSGTRIIDFAMGHGALILGHGDPDVKAAMHAQIDKGTHYGSGHEGERTWAELICRLIPSAERVRFVGSGTEANLLAMRLARTCTGKNTVLKFEGHFHGWNDYLIKSEKPPFESTSVAGVPDEVLRTVAVVPANEPDALEERLTQGDVAAVVIEPSGASWGQIPLDPTFLRTVRDLTTKYNVVLIFDEVITGFRWSPGGAQGRFEITPDMTTMAKIVAGGLPGGAVAGRQEIMEFLEFRDDAGWGKRKIIHPGTFNANPVTAAAATACLTKCANPAVQQHCDEMTARLRIGMNTVLENRSLPGCVWGESSAFHVILDQTPSNRTAG
ncbi:MAG: aminotransferase class III-fold pyridoxal phosphate-dependent enzyme, partial [Chloroflexota bacterium]|nr:aminotransferase class III-fold pyridoxal phosphate-dependent enzyme [Chloroflexota bacterium]